MKRIAAAIVLALVGFVNAAQAADDPTGSWKWTALAFFLPTACGMALCFFISSIARICGLA